MQGIAGAGSRLTDGRPVALLHLDAHTDSYDLPHWNGAIKSAANWADYLVRQGNVDPARSLQIGMRGNPRTLGWLQPSYDLGYEVVEMERYRELGLSRDLRPDPRSGSATRRSTSRSTSTASTRRWRRPSRTSRRA